jgi:hypothetical protein
MRRLPAARRGRAGPAAGRGPAAGGAGRDESEEGKGPLFWLHDTKVMGWKEHSEPELVAY